MQKKPADITADLAPEAIAMRRFFPVQPCAVFLLAPFPLGCDVDTHQPYWLHRTFPA